MINYTPVQIPILLLHVQGYGSTYEKDKHYGEKSYSISPKVEHIQTEIMTNGPVESAFRVYGDFPTYRSG